MVAWQMLQAPFLCILAPSADPERGIGQLVSDSEKRGRLALAVLVPLEGVTERMPEKRSTATKDLVALFAVAAAALVLAVYFDAFENFEKWARTYERWQIDELVVVPLVLAFAFGFYAWRRRGEIMESEQRFRSLVQNASDVILVMGTDRTVSYISPSVERVLGYVPEDVIGNDNLAPVHPDDMLKVQEAIARALSNPGTPSYMELRLGHADGSWRHIESACTNLLGDAAVSGVGFNSREVT